MILYSSTPDGIAQSQQFYDQYNLGANQNNAARFDAAQARALQATLTQRDYDQRAYQFNQGENFTAGQNELDRASREKDVQTQYASTDKNRTDALNQKDFDNAQRLAMVGQTPQTEDLLKTQYPNFDENQIKVLANASAQYGFNKFQSALQQSIGNGSPLPIESIKNFVNPASPIYQDAVDHRTSVIAPYVNQFNAADTKANKGNFASRIVADTTAAPLDISLGFGDFVRAPISSTTFALKNLVSPSVPASDVIQPRGDWQTRAPQIVAALSSGQNHDIVTDPVSGRFVPALLNPNASSQPAMIAGVQPQSQPAPVMADGSGRKWVYRGNMANPKLDANPNNWQLTQ